MKYFRADLQLVIKMKHINVPSANTDKKYLRMILENKNKIYEIVTKLDEVKIVGSLNCKSSEYCFDLCDML